MVRLERARPAPFAPEPPSRISAACGPQRQQKHYDVTRTSIAPGSHERDAIPTLPVRTLLSQTRRYHFKVVLLPESFHRLCLLSLWPLAAATLPSLPLRLNLPLPYVLRSLCVRTGCSSVARGIVFERRAKDAGKYGRNFRTWEMFNFRFYFRRKRRPRSKIRNTKWAVFKGELVNYSGAPAFFAARY